MSAIWVLHLFGGARATWSEGGASPVQLRPSVLSGETLEFRAASFIEVIQHCHKLRIEVLGAACITHKLELDGIMPAEWRTIHYQPHRTWLCHDAQRTWSQIAHEAGKAKSGRLWDCAARIAYQIEGCVERIQGISEGYATQLNSVVSRNAFRNGARMNDLWTQSVYLRIQSFLTDACILRDYLAEYGAAFIYRLDERRRITTLGKLIEKLEKTNCGDTIGSRLRKAAETGGWLAQLTSYRNLIIHSAPLALAQGQLWFRCKGIDAPSGKCFPTVRFPLPGDPAAIIKSRSKLDYDDFEFLSKQFAGPADVSSSMKDALRYAHKVSGELASLALEFAKHSPIVPAMPILTDADLQGPIKWTPS
jgi:hypothetical protein